MNRVKIWSKFISEAYWIVDLELTTSEIQFAELLTYWNVRLGADSVSKTDGQRSNRCVPADLQISVCFEKFRLIPGNSFLQDNGLTDSRVATC
jgi:hypothetical protein